MNHQPRIFISSVQKELAAERRALADFINGDPLLQRYFDLFLFEDLPATDRRADDVYLDEDTPIARTLAHLNLLENGHPNVRKPIPSYQIYRGTIFDLVDQAVGFVLSKVSRAVGTRSQSTQVPVEYEFPKEAVAEAVVNAIAHRDYASNASVQVMLFADRLEIWNPGDLPSALTTESLRVPHASIMRRLRHSQPWLAPAINKGTAIVEF